MRKLGIMIVAALAAIVGLGAWKAGMSEVENMQFQDDLHDLSTQVGIGANYKSPRSDDDFRDAVIRKAREHDIDLGPDQVTVRRDGSGMATTMYLAAEYTVQVKVPGREFYLHFTPNSTKQ
jgi:hypothetical protein